MQEYPKWLHRIGSPDVLVQSADEEAAQIAAWGGGKPNEAAVLAPAINKLVKAIDPPPPADEPPADDEVSALREQYQEKFGKRPFMGWNADTLRAKLAQAE